MNTVQLFVALFIILYKSSDNLMEFHNFVRNNQILSEHNLLQISKILKIVRLNRSFGTILVWGLGFLNAYSQTSPVIKYYFEKDTIHIGYSETFSNRLQFENRGKSQVTFVKKSVTAGALLALPDFVVVRPGEIRSVPVKYLSSAVTIKNTIQQFSASYTALGHEANDQAIFHTLISTESQLSLTSLEPIAYLNNETNRVSMRFRCVNNGYTPVRISLKLTSYPTGLQITGPLQQILSLDPGSQRVVMIEGINLNKDKMASDYSISVEAIDESGVSLATSSIKVVSLRSDKIQNLGQNHYTGLQSNTTAINYNSNNQGYSFYNLRANGNLQSADSTGFSYNANVNYYTQQQNLDLYDSWIGYRNKNFGLQIGNISDNLDYPIYGRGIKASTYLGKNNSVDFYAVQNNYLLLSANSQRAGANLLGLSYNYSNGLHSHTKTSLLYIQDPNTGISTFFTNSTTQIQLSETQHLELRGGLSREHSLLKTDLGYATGITYNNRAERWEIGLNNYYSTAYYSGLQRGVLLLDERISYRLNTKTALFVRYNYNKNAPDYQQSRSFLLNYGNKTISYETGINLAYGKINVGFKPYVLKQALSGSFLLGNTPGMTLSASSYRAELALSFQLAGGQFMLQGDYGYTNHLSGTKQKKTEGLKINASMSNKTYSLSALVQTAPYYLTDQIYARNKSEKFRLYSFGPGVHKDAFNGRMNLSANYYLSYFGNDNGWNNSVNGSASFRLKKGWEVTGQASYNTNTYYPGVYNLQSQVGILKHLSRSTAPGNAKLDVEFYSDDNSNGVRDHHEETMEGVIASLNPEGNAGGSALVTVSNKSGKISYQNLNKEAYSLRITQGGDRQLSKPVAILLNKNKKIQVPLVKSGWLKGRVNAIKQEYIASQPILEGMHILAKDANNQTFETYTNELGEFQFPLPVNEYTIIADIDANKFSIANTHQKVSVKQNNNVNINFEIKDISRLVIVKQF